MPQVCFRGSRFLVQGLFSFSFLSWKEVCWQEKCRSTKSVETAPAVSPAFEKEGPHWQGIIQETSLDRLPLDICCLAALLYGGGRTPFVKQTLRQLLRFRDGPAIFAGDTNLREAEVKQEKLAKEVIRDVHDSVEKLVVVLCTCS